MNYEQGLAALKHLAEGTSWYADFTLYQARLLENLDNEKRFGATDQTRASRAQIIDQLNHLALGQLGISFTDLCLGIIPNPQSSAIQVPSSPMTAAGNSVAQVKGRKGSTFHSSLEAAKLSRSSAFICYSHKDKRFLDELHVHLGAYTQMGRVNFWDDTKTAPGTKWREQIEQAIDSAKVAILLVSGYFLASDFIVRNELPPLLVAAEQEGAIILPVILRPCAFNDTVLAQFQAINAPSNPLSKMKPAQRDEVWVRVTELVRDALKVSSRF